MFPYLTYNFLSSCEFHVKEPAKNRPITYTTLPVLQQEREWDHDLTSCYKTMFEFTLFMSINSNTVQREESKQLTCFINVQKGRDWTFQVQASVMSETASRRVLKFQISRNCSGRGNKHRVYINTHIANALMAYAPWQPNVKRWMSFEIEISRLYLKYIYFVMLMSFFS